MVMVDDRLARGQGGVCLGEFAPTLARVRFIAQPALRLEAAGWGAVGRGAKRVRVGDNGSLAVITLRGVSGLRSLFGLCSSQACEECVTRFGLTCACGYTHTFQTEVRRVT